MLLADLQNSAVLEQLPIVDGLSPQEAGELLGHLRIGEFAVLPVAEVACHMDGQVDPEILDDSGTSLGTLCLTAKLAGTEPAALTKWQYAAYLADAEASRAGSPHTFKRNYVILNCIYLQDYLDKYFQTAPVWGSFSHHASPPPLSRRRERLVATRQILFPTRHHNVAFGRYIAANGGFERFLRLYHTLELMFDFAFFKSVQKLNDDMDGFSTLSRAYGKTELDKLKQIILEFCDNWEDIASEFSPVAEFETKAYEIFQNHTKDGNPLTTKWDKMIAACRAGQTTQSDFLANKLCDKNLPYDKFVASVAAYWIYRIRSSIAHSRVSEFLFEDADEDFVVDFSEKLLNQIVRQVFSSTKLSSLLKRTP